MAIYPEDDDLDLERELEELENHKENMARDFDGMAKREHYLRKRIAKRQLDPLVAKALDLAQNLGHVVGANEALGNKIKNLNKRIAIRDEEIERTNDRDELLARAEAAEATIERSKKARRRR
jgi:uncharacterized small protein (DUF1192 family)